MLPPQSAVAVEMSSEKPWYHDYEIVEPIPDFFLKTRVLVPEYVAATSGDKTLVWVTNVSIELRILPQGARVATLALTPEDH